jgi:PAS domain S-box-containing protein
MTEDQIRRMTNPSKQLDDALREQRELLSVTLSSIGDAVIATDIHGCVTYMNPVAQTLTGWTQAEAAGKSLATIFTIINETNRQTAVNPAIRAFEEGVIVGLTNHTLLIAKDGSEWPIEDSAAPIRNAEGKVAGVVLVFREVAERRRKEKLAEDALAYADNILATLREPFLVLDQDLRVVTANRSFYETFGVAAAETQGRFIYELGNRQWEIPKLRTLLEDVLPRNHAFQGFEVEHDFSSIGRKIMLLNARRIQKPGNNSELILLAIEDVTERRFAEAASSTLASIVESSDDVIISKTLDGIITSWNGSAERLFGYTKAETLGRNIAMIIPAERQAEEDGVLAGVRRGEKVEHFETERITKDGRRLSISLTVSPIKSATGEIIGASKIARDISQRRQTQLQLEVSETRFRRLFEAAHDGILILDAASQKITQVNPFLVDLLDYPAEHFLGKELWEIGFLRDKEASQSAMQQLYDQGEIRYESLPLEDRLGCLHPVEMVANVYDEGRHRVIQCNIRDISIRSGLEKLLRGQASELSDLHRRKDEFLAMLSHELRSPLAPIANALQLLGLQRGSENRIQQQARGIIERQLAQLQHLVDDLLEVSRITTGRVQLRREPVDVSDIVAGAVETVRPLIEQRRHELTIALSPETICLHADAARLEQVLVNLLTNAAKYTEEGGHIWLSVELASGGHQPPDIHNECVLRVRDTGVGIAAALLPRIFDLFTQAERSLDRSQGGLGIGLALVHRLTELHGGTVEVNSTLGQGSEFIVRLPVIPVEAQPASPTGEPGEPATRPLRVLVVDDNLDTVLTFSILLKASGHDVRTANDGPTGVEAALSYRPDVALLDIGLPGLNGYEVAKRIRQEPTLKNAVLVALTGYGQETDRETSRQAGFNHHLVKPANFDKLQQILANAAEQLVPVGF